MSADQVASLQREHARKWRPTKISDLCTLVNGRGFKPYEWSSRGLPIIRIQNLNGSAEFNYFNGSFDPKIAVTHGDLLFAWSGSRRSSFGPHIWSGGDAVLNYHTWKVVPREAVDRRFLFHALRGLTRSIEDSAHGASALVHVQKREIERMNLLVPDISEQMAVAEALDDADRQLGSLELLIAKKRDIKQGMMQGLLTGRTRLPGFSGKWSTRSLSTFGNFLRGSGIKRDEVRRAGVPCIRYGEIYTTFEDYTLSTVSFVDDSVAAMALPLRWGDILFAGSGETKAEIGMNVAYIGETPAVAGGDIIVLRGSDYDPVFLATLLNTPEIANQKARGGQGDAVVHIHSRVLAGLEVTVPQLPEQQAIAQVLTDADGEIVALERRLDSTRAIKQGMMQELLTGSTRLSAAEEVSV